MLTRYMLAMGLMLTMETNAGAEETRPVTAALFEIGTNGLCDPKTNSSLKAVLATRPSLDAYETAAVGTRAALEVMLKKDRSLVAAYGPTGWTLLHMAAFAGNVETAKLLIEKGAEVHARAKTRFLNTPLLVSLLTGQIETAELLLEHGASVLERQAKGFTALHAAAFLGRADLVELLLAHGAELDAKTNDGRTALTEALRRNHPDLAALLRSKGAAEVPLSDALMKKPD